MDIKDGDEMDDKRLRIKFYSIDDWSLGHSMNEALLLLADYDENAVCCDVNDAIELYNIYQCSATDLKPSNWTDDEHSKFKDLAEKLKKAVARFFSSLNDVSFLGYYSKVEAAYFADFWLLFEHYKAYNKISPDIFSSAIGNAHIPLRYVLHNKNTVQKYGQILANAMMSNAENATILLSPHIENLSKDEPKTFFPIELTPELKEKLVCDYIGLEFANSNYLKLIAQFKGTDELVMGDKTKLAAKRKYEAENKTFFENHTGFTFGVEIAFSDEQHEEKTMRYDTDKRVTFLSYSSTWLKENLDYPTLLNNFIYLFEYTDHFFRSGFPSHPTRREGFYELIHVRGKNDYNTIGMDYKVSHMMFDAQMVMYYRWLLKSEIKLEEIFKWFFEEYLQSEFGAHGFTMSIPSATTTYLEKCKLLASEIDGVLKQFSFFVEDGHIDRELLEITSKPLLFNAIPSFCGQKYIYAKSNTIKNCMALLFSTQSRLSHFQDAEIGDYDNFASICSGHALAIDIIKPHQKPYFDYLLETDCVTVDDGQIYLNREKVGLLRDLYYNQVTCINYLPSHKPLFTSLENSDDICIESSLFSKPEQDYLDYVLSNKKFGNNLELRNRYIHSTHTLLEGDHQRDYIQFLKIMVLIIIKINEEFCLRETLASQESNS